MYRVLVIGSGIAGLVSAIRASDAGHDVVLATKDRLAESNTRYAQGGIAAALFPDDSPALHASDTMTAGAGHADPAAVRTLCSEGPDRVRDLIRFGVRFDRGESGLARGMEAAHSRARILHAQGDATGREIQRALCAALRTRRVKVREHTMLTGLLVEAGRAIGARFLEHGSPTVVHADSVILATGGAGQLYARTTNPEVATGDGIAAAWRAGAIVVDTEFVQFHPTALAIPGTPLVSEAVRGEGAVLLNERGDRFMRSVHADAELAPRDIVARAIAAEMRTQGGRPVLLDASKLGANYLASRFPGIDAAVRAAGYDWSESPIPVTPAAHYTIGGVMTDLSGRTTIPGLFAVGEVARSGVHGANRLASNSLLEAAVFAERAVDALGSVESDHEFIAPPHPTEALPPDHPRSSETFQPTTRGFSRTRLQQLMWEHAGLRRTGIGLSRAASTLEAWVQDLPEPVTAIDHENRNLLDVALLTVRAALARPDSAGSHYRSDTDAMRTTTANEAAA